MNHQIPNTDRVRIHHGHAILFVTASMITLGACSASDQPVEDASPRDAGAKPAATAAPANANSVPNHPVVIPQPTTFEAPGRWHAMAGPVTIARDTAFESVVQHVANGIKERTGAMPPVRDAGANNPAPTFLFTSRDVPNNLGDEGYELSIDPERVVLRARTPHGAFNGWQTIRQLLDQGAVITHDERRLWLPECRIVDRPRFKWRGMHLDVSRHFFKVDFVKRYIDLLAYHRFNTFHWHLTDDQGWRIEIKKYPKLTTVGAWRDELGGPYGGFYTQDEIRDVVAYAAERFITVVPEIEMPGHAMAALAAYPEYSCTGGPFEVPTKWGVFDDVYCAGNDGTLEFLDNVLGEVCQLFPSPVIHVGGDECPKTRWKNCPKCQARIKEQKLANEGELQSWVMHQAQAMLKKRGKRMIGWDEILEGGLAPNAEVMSWRGMDGGIAAANQGHDVVMCPTSHCYFDYRQSASPGEKGPAWSKITNTRDVYGFDPMPGGLDALKQKHVQGSQGNIWTEWLKTPDDIEYMAFPRAAALAEVVWSPADGRNWDAFRKRLEVHLERLKRMNVNYRKPD